MLNTTKAFLFGLFEMFIVYIVLGNFLGWSGGAIDLTNYNVDWQNSYIGFESFTNAINDFQYTHQVLSFGLFDLDHFVQYLTLELDVLMGGIPNLITKLVNVGNITAWEVIEFVFKLLIQPLLVVFYFLCILACVLIYFVTFVIIFFRFVGGNYNVWASSTDDVWNQWSYLSSEWNWSSILQVPVL